MRSDKSLVVNFIGTTALSGLAGVLPILAPSASDTE